MYSRLHRVFRDFRPDIVHTHIQVLRYALPSMLLLKHASLLHTIHNLAEREVEPRARFIQRYAFKHGVVPIGVAAEVALRVEHLYGVQNCRVISDGIRLAGYARPDTSRK